MTSVCDSEVCIHHIFIICQLHRIQNIVLDLKCKSFAIQFQICKFGRRLDQVGEFYQTICMRLVT